MPTKQPKPGAHNPVAKSLRSPHLRPRIVPDKTKYDRKRYPKR